MLEINQNIKKTIGNLLVFNILFSLLRLIPSVIAILRMQDIKKITLSLTVVQLIDVATLYAMFLIVLILTVIQVTYRIKSILLIFLCVLQIGVIFQIFRVPFALMRKSISIPIAKYEDATMLLMLIILAATFFVCDYLDNRNTTL